tara:strand:- start:261 stop:1682 length:1422 start_codon:yes stop_codon:yes gene_type:complete
MPSFRARVLEALDIEKKTIKLQVNETFPQIYKEEHSPGAPLAGNDAACTLTNRVPYAVSKTIMNTTIGPNPIGGGAIKQSLELLGFVVGKEIVEPTWTATSQGIAAGALYRNMYPITTPQTLSEKSGSNETTVVNASTDADANSAVGHAGGQDSVYTGFHQLNGLYDSESKELKSMRKSALPVLDLDTQSPINSSTATEHAHKDWPNNALDQHHLLNEHPYADSLYYGSMRLSMLLTGISIPQVSEAASNHRGMVRMLILRPRLPNIKMRWDGVANQPHINMAYPPHWDTELFFSKKKTLGGRLDTGVYTNTANAAGATGTKHADEAHLTPTFGLLHRRASQPVIDNNVRSLHYGHRIPDNESTLSIKPHNLTSYDVLTAPINREKYAVIVDKIVTLDTVHHGVASKRIENITIPFNKKVKFPGREQSSSATTLGDVTIDEPLNMESRPLIMFLSMDQKISCQISGYTTISEC